MALFASYVLLCVMCFLYVLHKFDVMVFFICNPKTYNDIICFLFLYVMSASPHSPVDIVDLLLEALMPQLEEAALEPLALRDHVAERAHPLQVLPQLDELPYLGDEHALGAVDEVLVGAVDDERFILDGHDERRGRRDGRDRVAPLELPVVEDELRVEGRLDGELRLRLRQVHVLVELVVEQLDLADDLELALGLRHGREGREEALLVLVHVRRDRLGFLGGEGIKQCALFSGILEFTMYCILGTITMFRINQTMLGHMLFGKRSQLVD